MVVARRKEVEASL